MRKKLCFLTLMHRITGFIIACIIIGLFPCSISCAKDTNSQTNSTSGTLDYSEKAINDSLENYSYEENPYYLEALEEYFHTFNGFYQDIGSKQEIEIISLESALKDAGISKSLRKKILSTEGKNVLEDADFKRVQEEEDLSLFFSKGNYYEVSSRAKDDIDEIDVIVNVLYYLGDLKDNKPNGEGALFLLTDSGIRLEYAGGFKEGRKDGKGISFSTDSFGSLILGQGKYKEQAKEGKYIEYNVFDIQQLYYDFCGNKWTEYEEYYYSNYSENDKAQADVFKKSVMARLLYITQKYEGEEFDSFFLVRVGYPVIKPIISYEGECKGNVYAGKGTLYGRVGTIWYEGGFKGGMYSGKGTIYYAMTGIKQYEGEFRNGMMKGKGTLYNTDGTVRKKGKFDGEEVDYDNELLEEMGLYQYITDETGELDVKDFFEKQ